MFKGLETIGNNWRIEATNEGKGGIWIVCDL